MEASTFTVRLDELLRAGQYEDAACLLDEAELERDDAAADEAVLKEWPSALHILCLILSDRLADARFLYKRLPQPCAALDEVQAAWTVLRLLWQQKHSEVWAVLQRAPWSPRAAAAAAALTEKLRGEVAALLGKAYTTLGLAKAAGVLGLSEAEAAAAAQRLGWELDPGAGLLRLPRARLAAEAHGAGSRLQQLVDYVVHLEQ
uniref:CSN8/PSMD8/EIF3K domain-containing protein n=1 Tax=Tetraselmis sp. GSL018 TaxID=582737 RepID=A0A061S9L0_9CHLO